MNPSYVLVTAAYNEEAYIKKALQAVAAQTYPPLRWIIVSDGSTDRTDQIVRDYTRRSSFLELLILKKQHQRNFSAQVEAINAGLAQLRQISADYIGNLDADISFEPSYYARLLRKFEENPRLGLGGGYIHEEHDGQFHVRRTNSTASVPHGVQLFRRDCFRAIGGYIPLKYGGPDWHAEVCARMNGWQVEAFPDLKVFHHRPTGTADRLLRHWFRQGRMDFALGSDPLFEIVKCMRRLPEKPLIAGAVSRLSGFGWSHFAGEPRPVSDDFVRFLRNEQRHRLLPSFHRLARD